MLRALTAVASVATLLAAVGSLPVASPVASAFTGGAVHQDTQASPVFYIAGHVRSPGRYPLRDGMTVVEAIAVAGGLTERGSTRRIKIRRMVDGALVDVTVTLSDLVQDKDTLSIPSRQF